MRVHVVGLGKLGLPVALTLRNAGHSVTGWDTSPARRNRLAPAGLRALPTREANPEVVLVCVQTPHAPRFDGTTPLVCPPEDFDYSYLGAALGEVSDAVRQRGDDPLVAIVSTCLPGTFDRELRDMTEGVRVAYHPLFVAMGSVVKDFCDPEFVLVGCDGPFPIELRRLYAPVHSAPFRVMSIRSAELAKVAYNAAIGFKLQLANAVGEVSDRIGADADDVMETLKLATKRIASDAYLTPGMGDGGPCHPRDQIALSWLADELRLSSNPFAGIVRSREAHARWLAHLWREAAGELPLVMLGTAYKPETTLTDGSAAALVAHYATGAVRSEDAPFDMPVACYFLACPHRHFLTARPPAGSVVVDPWGLFPNQPGVGVVRPGRRGEVRASQDFLVPS